MPHIVTLDNVNRLRVSVNGRELETRKWQKPDGAYMVEAQVPGHLLVKRGFARVDLMCTPRAPCDVIPGWPDRRLLGITMDRISLSPVG